MSSSQAIKMGAAFVQLFVEDNLAYRQLDKFGTAFKGWGQRLQQVGGTAAQVGTRLLRPLIDNLKEVTDRASSLQLLSDRLGSNIGLLSRLQGGFERAGVSADSFQAQIEAFRLRLQEAANSNDYLSDRMRSLGTGAHLVGLGLKGALYELAEFIARTPEAANRILALRDAGISVDLLPFLEKGRAGVDQLLVMGEASALTAEEGRQAVAVSKALSLAWAELKDTARQIGLALLPTAARIAELKGQFTAGLQAVRDWIKENRGAIVTGTLLAAGLVAAGTAVVGLGTTFVITGGTILATLAAVKAALALTFSWTGLVAAGLYLFATQTEAGREAAAGLSESLVAVGTRAKGAFQGIAAAVQAGDWTRAFKIGVAYLKAEWATFNVYLVTAWNWTKDLFINGWHQTIRQLKTLFVDLGAFVLRNTVGRFREALILMAAAVRAAAPGIAGRKAAEPIEAAAAAIPSDRQINRKRDETNANLRAEEMDGRRDRNARWRAEEATAVEDERRAREELRDLIQKGGSGGGWWGRHVFGAAQAVGDGIAGADRPGGVIPTEAEGPPEGRRILRHPTSQPPRTRPEKVPLAPEEIGRAARVFGIDGEGNEDVDGSRPEDPRPVRGRAPQTRRGDLKYKCSRAGVRRTGALHPR